MRTPRNKTSICNKSNFKDFNNNAFKKSNMHRNIRSMGLDIDSIIFSQNRRNEVKK